MESLERTGYAQLVPSGDPFDAIASLEHSIPGDALACWNSDGPCLEDFVAPADAPTKATPPATLTTASMVPLGTTVNPDPLWEYYALHTDHLGSVRAVTNSTGAIVSTHNFFPFGEEIPKQKFSYNTHQYTGHERDKETGLDYMLARYYEAGLGRFLSVDPGTDVLMLEPQSWNKFAYTRNNPINFVDPNGLEVILGINTNVDPSAGFMDGHAWLTKIDTDAVALDTYSVFDDSARFVDANGPGGDLRHNVEVQHPVEYTAINSRYMSLSDDQVKVLETELARDETWQRQNTCANWSSRVWKKVTGESLDATEKLGTGTPRVLAGSIQDKNGQDRRGGTSSDGGSSKKKPFSRGASSMAGRTAKVMVGGVSQADVLTGQ